MGLAIEGAASRSVTDGTRSKAPVVITCYKVMEPAFGRGHEVTGTSVSSVRKDVSSTASLVGSHIQLSARKSEDGEQNF